MSRWTLTRISRRSLASLCLRILCWGCLLLTPARSQGQEPSTKETQIKAAFIYNFSKFVEWPEERLTSNTVSLVIGVVGDNPVRTELEAITRERKISGRPIEVRVVRTAEEAAATHVLFLGTPEENPGLSLVSGLKEQAVLTVGESERFAAGGGMITFVREGDKLRFRINVESAEHARIVISAQLRKLAQGGPKRN